MLAQLSLRYSTTADLNASLTTGALTVRLLLGGPVTRSDAAVRVRINEVVFQLAAAKTMSLLGAISTGNVIVGLLGPASSLRAPFLSLHETVPLPWTSEARSVPIASGVPEGKIR
jgi:hypothetical protein